MSNPSSVQHWFVEIEGFQWFCQYSLKNQALDQCLSAFVCKDMVNNLCLRAEAVQRNMWEITWKSDVAKPKRQSIYWARYSTMYWAEMHSLPIGGSLGVDEKWNSMLHFIQVFPIARNTTTKMEYIHWEILSAFIKLRIYN